MAKKKTWNLDAKLKLAIRKVWAFSPSRRSALKSAYLEDQRWRCSICSRDTERAHVDHISPVGLFTGWDSYIRAMFEGELQVLCRECHLAKTKEDVKAIKHAKTSKNSNRKL
jgi:5-methylcytosine-specific restriction endonuclease McrA